METGAALGPIAGIVKNDMDFPGSAITTIRMFFLYYIFQCHSNIKRSFSCAAFRRKVLHSFVLFPYKWLTFLII